METELEQLENEAIKLQNKIDNTKDSFFIYGWVRNLEEIKQKIKQLKS